MKKTKTRINRSASLQRASLVLPGLIIFTIGLIIPLIMGIRYSMTSWNGFDTEKVYVGLANYKKMVSDPYVGQAWGFTLKFTLFNTIIQNVLAILLALALDSSIRCKKLFRTIFFIPCLISPVIVGYIWLKMFNNILPSLVKLADLDINVRLFGKSDTVLTGLLIANNWQWVGYWALIYLAALQSIPTELFEAAKVDGANAIQQFFKVKLPMLGPALTICIVGITTGSIKVYDLLVSSTGGGPGYASTSIIMYIYDTALGGHQYGYGSALSVSLILVLLVIAVFQVKTLRKREVQL